METVTIDEAQEALQQGKKVFSMLGEVIKIEWNDWGRRRIAYFKGETPWKFADTIELYLEPEN